MARTELKKIGLLVAAVMTFSLTLGACSYADGEHGFFFGRTRVY